MMSHTITSPFIKNQKDRILRLLSRDVVKNSGHCKNLDIKILLRIKNNKIKLTIIKTYVEGGETKKRS